LLQDWHPENHIAFYDLYPGKKPFEFIEIDRGPLKGRKQQLWPRHCVRNTPGAWFHPDLDITGNLLIHKGTNPDIDSLSGFYDDHHIQNTGLTQILRRLGITHVDVIGLATEFCVGLTALDAISDGFTTRLLTEGSRGLDEKAIQAMYERIIAAGGEVV
jgi:nicotinamidase/pyrazinamidase